jgi:hypothetical protein
VNSLVLPKSFSGGDQLSVVNLGLEGEGGEMGISIVGLVTVGAGRRSLSMASFKFRQRESLFTPNSENGREVGSLKSSS